MIILLTDGSYNAGEVEPLVAAQVAGAYDIKIYAIGAGTHGTALVPVAAPGGGTDYLSSEVSIDEATLIQIAQLTNGKYFRATDAEALRAIYGEIDRLEKAGERGRAPAALRRDSCAGPRSRSGLSAARGGLGHHPPAHHPLTRSKDALRRLACRLPARAGARAAHAVGYALRRRRQTLAAFVAQELAPRGCRRRVSAAAGRGRSVWPERLPASCSR